jgi:hypothetical protein
MALAVAGHRLTPAFAEHLMGRSERCNEDRPRRDRDEIGAGSQMPPDRIGGRNHR